MILESEEIVKQLVNEIKNSAEALRASVRLSGKSEKQFYLELDYDAGHWSRILSGNAHMDLDKLPKFQLLSGNDLVCRHIAKQCGYDIQPSYQALEEYVKELKAQIKYLESKQPNINF